MSELDEQWYAQSKSFDASAYYYDRFRPSYPEAIINEIIRKSNVTSESKILEIGAGSGKATELFVDKGLSLTCIEPGANLAEEGRKKFSKTKQVEYVVNRFEDWEETKEYFDLIISAQAFHWVPKPLGFEKSSNALKKNKYIGLFWNFYLDNEQEVDKELKKIISEYSIIYLDTKDECEKRIKSNFEEIESSGYFKNLEVIRYPWSQTYSTEEYIAFIKTGNGYLTLSDNDKKTVESKVRNIINKHGAFILRPYICVLFFAQKV